MQKKLITLAVAGALGAPILAYAQASTVEIYGRANLAWQNWRATGSSVVGGNLASRTRIADSGSRIGFRINENLGGGLRAFAVIESGANIDTGTVNGQSGAANTSTGTLATRTSYLGLGGSWGDVRMGRQDVYWVSGPLTQTGPNYVDQTADFITDPGILGIPAARNNNVLSYNSPTWSGFNFTVSYSPNATEAATYTGTGQAKDDLYGITLRYNAPQFYVQGDWARRRNGFASGAGATAAAAAATFVTPATGAGRIVGMKAGLGWRYQPGAMISFLAERLRNDNVAAIAGIAAAGDDLKQNIYLINWEHTFGQWAVYALYAWSTSVKGLTGAAGATDPGNTKSKGYTLAAKYHFSKRTGAYISYSQIRNQANQWADASGGGMSSAGAGGIAAGNAGADPRNIGIGMLHNF